MTKLFLIHDTNSTELHYARHRFFRYLSDNMHIFSKGMEKAIQVIIIQCEADIENAAILGHDTGHILIYSNSSNVISGRIFELLSKLAARLNNLNITVEDIHVFTG